MPHLKISRWSALTNASLCVDILRQWVVGMFDSIPENSFHHHIQKPKQLVAPLKINIWFKSLHHQTSGRCLGQTTCSRQKCLHLTDRRNAAHSFDFQLVETCLFLVHKKQNSLKDTKGCWHLEIWKNITHSKSCWLTLIWIALFDSEYAF